MLSFVHSFWLIPKLQENFGIKSWSCPWTRARPYTIGTNTIPTLLHGNTFFLLLIHYCSLSRLQLQTCDASKGEKKYFSIAENPLKLRKQCGECCMTPADYPKYHKFEKNLTLASTNTPCADAMYTDYLQTDTHGKSKSKLKLLCI
jgi:hypothetical protein